MADTTDSSKKVRRNITLDNHLDEWLSQDVNNASALIDDLLKAYRAYGNAMEAIEYVDKKHNPGRRE